MEFILEINFTTHLYIEIFAKNAKTLYRGVERILSHKVKNKFGDPLQMAPSLQFIGANIELGANWVR